MTLTFKLDLFRYYISSEFLILNVSNNNFSIYVYKCTIMNQCTLEIIPKYIIYDLIFQKIGFGYYQTLLPSQYETKLTNQMKSLSRIKTFSDGIFYRNRVCFHQIEKFENLIAQLRLYYLTRMYSFIQRS